MRSSRPEVANDHVTTYINYAKGLLCSTARKLRSAADRVQRRRNKLRAAEDKIYKFQAENDMITVTLEEHQSLVSQNILNSPRS